MSQTHQVGLLTTSILTADGSYTLETISLDEARALVAGGGFISAVGHESTAQVMSTLLSVEVPVNRIQFAQEAGRVALVFKLNRRLPEGTVLTASEIEEIGYSFKKLARTA